MGEVYLAQDTRLGRKIALKLLPPEFTIDAQRVQRFEQEARAASALSHPNVCVIHEIGDTQDGRRFITMEYIEGTTLRQQLAHKRLQLIEALDVAAQIAAGLAVAHAAGIVHRDIKPENVMLRDDGLVKVLDFGLAKLTQPTTETDAEALMRSMVKTGSGMIMGTVAYMSPEQARGQAVDGRTDIWSLGVILYEMVARRLPFPGKTPSDRVVAILEREPEPLGHLRRGVPAELERIVGRALTKNRDERYTRVVDLAEDLRKVRATLGAESRFRFALPAPARGLLFSRKRRAVALSALLLVIIAAVVGGLSYRSDRESSTPPLTEIKLLAVLPLKSLNREAGDAYLGLGIADTIITNVSQVGGLTVRPTSAVRKYADQEIDSLEAARQMQADAVLDGTYLRAGDKLRVNVNLLRVRDGASLWAESFDVRFTDIFAIQDEVSKEVAARLRVKLNPAEQTRLAKRHTTNPEAYSYYSKAMYHLSKRGFTAQQEETEIAIDLLKKAIELDPNYALARAQLGYAYAWLVDTDYKEGNPALIASAKEELRVAERLDPQLAVVHLARSWMAWSQYGNWQIEEAIREARLAKRLDPNVDEYTILAGHYYHVGLEEQSAEEFERVLARDPTNDFVKRSYVNLYSSMARWDDWLALNQRLFNRGPDARYYLEKRMLKEAEPLIEQAFAENPEGPHHYRGLLLALQGRHRKAQAEVHRIIDKIPRNKTSHHRTYDLARIYALDGKSEEALKWLRKTANEGFPCYPLFARDSFLDPIRKDPAFIQFMAEMKTRWEGYRREFG